MLGTPWHICRIRKTIKGHRFCPVSLSSKTVKMETIIDYRASQTTYRASINDELDLVIEPTTVYDAIIYLTRKGDFGALQWGEPGEGYYVELLDHRGCFIDDVMFINDCWHISWDRNYRVVCKDTYVTITNQRQHVITKYASSKKKEVAAPPKEEPCPCAKCVKEQVQEDAEDAGDTWTRTLSYIPKHGLDGIVIKIGERKAMGFQVDSFHHSMLYFGDTRFCGPDYHEDVEILDEQGRPFQRLQEQGMFYPVVGWKLSHRPWRRWTHYYYEPEETGCFKTSTR